jgi:hypothetical protein
MTSAELDAKIERAMLELRRDHILYQALDIED